MSELERRVVELTNAERRAHGCPDLAVDDRLTASAGAHSDDMVARGFFSHDNPDGESPQDRIRDSGFPGPMTGENIGLGQRTPEEIMQGWMNSSGHRANILRCEYDRIGVGVTAADGGYAWTQNFGATG